MTEEGTTGPVATVGELRRRVGTMATACAATLGLGMAGANSGVGTGGCAAGCSGCGGCLVLVPALVAGGLVHLRGWRAKV